MAFTPVFTYSFLDIADSVGVTPTRYRITFLRDGYSGTVTTLTASEVPFTPKIADSNDERFSTILPHQYTFSLYCESFWQAKSLYVTDINELQVHVEKDETGTGNNYADYCWGWVQAQNLTEAYQGKPYPVEINAACGLSLLKGKPLLDKTGKRFQGKIPVTTVLQTALSLTGLSLDMETGFNRFELADVNTGQAVNGKANPAVDPLNHAYIDAGLLVQDNDEVVSAYEALKIVLAPFGLRCAQINGRWVILNGDECAGGYDPFDASGKTIHTRTYPQSASTPGPQSHTSRNLSVTTNRYGQLPVHEGYQKRVQAQPGVRVSQNFGRSVSTLGDFSNLDNATGLPIGYVVNNLENSARARNGTGTELDPYRLVINGSGDEKFNLTTPYIARSIVFDQSSPTFSQAVQRTFKGKARLTNVQAAKLVFAAKCLESGKIVGYFLTSSGWKKQNELKSSELVGLLQYNVYKDPITGYQVPKPDWFSYSIDLGTLSNLVQLDYYYCQAEALDHPTAGLQQVEYQAGTIELGETNGAIQLTGTQITYVKPGKLVSDSALTISLGDVPLSAGPFNHVGTLYQLQTNGTVVPSTRWYRADQTVGNNGVTATSGKPLLQILAESYANQTMQPATVWEGTLIGRLPWGVHTVIYIEDIGDETISPLVPYPFQITRLESDLRMATHKVTLVRIMPPLDLSVYNKTAEWQTPNGPILISETDAISATPPNSQVSAPISAQDQLKQSLVNLGILKPSLSSTFSLPGFAPNDTGVLLTADAYLDGQLVGSSASSYRKTVDLPTL